MKLRFVLVLLLLTLSCRTSVLPPLCVAERPDRPPSNAEVLAYLQGKALPVEHLGSASPAIDLAGIEALSVARNSVRAHDEAWSTDLSFIYNTGRARYTVEAVVEHRVVDGQRIFNGFALKGIIRR
jgi:hypothetical protein